MSETLNQRINADFERRVVLDSATLPWIASPQHGVERRMLDRIGGEIARATTIVRYAPKSRFGAHVHELGEEFLVLDGVFSDEAGDYAQGTYVRNPPGSRHAPFNEQGCVILVKLRQMGTMPAPRVVIDTADFQRKPVIDVARLTLFERPGDETVSLVKLAPGASIGADGKGGEEIFVLDGVLDDTRMRHRKGTWIRNPVGARRSLASPDGAIFWLKWVARFA
jgi:anti-sigma factor ChrR (cupin superfamily)